MDALISTNSASGPNVRANSVANNDAGASNDVDTNNDVDASNGADSNNKPE
jgi:hypothetical protein